MTIKQIAAEEVYRQSQSNKQQPHKIVSSMTYGIDYGFGTTNIDKRGIRYSRVSIGRLADWVLSEAEPVYADDDIDDDGEIDEFAEPVHWAVRDEDEGVYLIIRGGEAIIEASPVAQHVAFCSPCFPGAGDLDSPAPIGQGAFAYSLPEEWWADGPTGPLIIVG